MLLALLLLSDGRGGPHLHVLGLIVVRIDHHTVLTMEAVWEVGIAALRNPTVKAMRQVLLSIVTAIHVEATA